MWSFCQEMGPCLPLGLAYFLLGLILLLALKIYLTATCGVCKCRNSMQGKTVIVTGSNSGIGRETALDLAKRGARVIMACRNLETAFKVRDQIVEESKNEDVVVKKLDLTSLQSVRDFASEVNKSEPRLDVLIHNAGVATACKEKITADGLEMITATNQYGPFLLTHLLIDLLKKSAPSRIVVVSSEVYRFCRFELKNANPINKFKILLLYKYFYSKFENILFTRELARRLKGSGVTANCLHPGLIATPILRKELPFWFPYGVVSFFFLKNPEQGAQTTIHCAVAPELEGVSGKYFTECKETELHGEVKDMILAKNFWDICEKLVQLTPSDPRI